MCRPGRFRRAAIDVMVPEIPRRIWDVALDTAQASPRDIVASALQKPHRRRHYRASARSVVVLEARTKQRTSEARSQ
jgi:glycogen operon protein